MEKVVGRESENSLKGKNRKAEIQARRADGGEGKGSRAA